MTTRSSSFERYIHVYGETATAKYEHIDDSFGPFVSAISKMKVYYSYRFFAFYSERIFNHVYWDISQEYRILLYKMREIFYCVRWGMEEEQKFWFDEPNIENLMIWGISYPTWCLRGKLMFERRTCFNEINKKD